MLLGQTLDGMRVWDVRRAIQAFKQMDQTRELPPVIRGCGAMAGIALYASLFEPGIASLDLTDLPETHGDGPVLLNVLRYLDMPQATGHGGRTTRRSYCMGRTHPAWQFPQIGR